MLPALSDRRLSASEMVIHRLYEITSHYDAGFAQQVRELLALGCDRFDLDIGIVASIAGGDYEVLEAVVPEGVELGTGDRFDLAETYCSITIDADGPIGFEHAGESTYSRHPAYATSKLEAYIGIPIYVAGHFYGTINFSSSRPRPRSFEAVDIDCLKLMASWVSTELQRRQTEGELAKARRHLEHLVRTDPLTELRNRRGMAEVLQDHARRSRFGGSALSCVLVDIDDFKVVNDNYGHSSGDRVIRSIADGIRGCLRPTDAAARIGGDEFLVVLPGASVCVAAVVAQRIAEAVRCLDLVDDGVPFPVTVSIGVADVPSDAASVTDILECTEELLRRSKMVGKNTVSVGGCAIEKAMARAS